jgi:transposase-like protein
MSKRKSGREAVESMLEAVHDKTDTNLMRLETETEHQEKMYANPKEIKEHIKTNQAIRAVTKAIQAK